MTSQRAVEVVSFLDDWILVEYEDEDGLQRKFVPRALVEDIFKKGPALLSEDLLNYSMEYSNVDLVDALGEELPLISVRKLQDQFRRAGLWTRADYQNNLDKVAAIFRRNMPSVSEIMNAATGPIRR